MHVQLHEGSLHISRTKYESGTHYNKRNYIPILALLVFESLMHQNMMIHEAVNAGAHTCARAISEAPIHHTTFP